jgi:hypothetical protein
MLIRERVDIAIFNIMKRAFFLISIGVELCFNRLNNQLFNVSNKYYIITLYNIDIYYKIPKNGLFSDFVNDSIHSGDFFDSNKFCIISSVGAYNSGEEAQSLLIRGSNILHPISRATTTILASTMYVQILII